MRIIIFLIVIFNIIFNNVHTARILGLFHFPSKSHQMVFDSLMKKLAERDHKITVATFFPLETRPNNYTEINLNSLASLKLETVHMGAYEFPPWYMRIPVIGSIIDQYDQLITLQHSALSICQKLTKFTPLNDALKKQYDVVIIETLNDGCILGLLDAYGINVPIIGISSSVRLPEDTRRMGADNNPSYVPIVTTSFTHQMSFLERLENVIMAAVFKLHYQEFRNKERAIIENHFGKAIKDINDMEISLMFVNTFPIFNGVYPIVPGIIEIGGIHIQPGTKLLPTFIQRFINESEYGVIIFSFGSQISSTSLSKHKQDMFLNAFAKLKQRVLWKYTDSPEEGTMIGKNVLQVRWLPQFELLRHPKIKAIIYHGGLLGLTEAISAGKPVLVIPIFVDQRVNAAAVKAAGVGEILSLRDIQEHDIDRALKSVLSDKMCERARRVSAMWHDRERSPLDTAVYWTERVIRWGNESPLYSQAKHLSFYQYTMLDVVAFIALIIISIFATIYLIIVRTYKYLKLKLLVIKEKMT